MLTYCPGLGPVTLAPLTPLAPLAPNTWGGGTRVVPLISAITGGVVLVRVAPVPLAPPAPPAPNT